jgi:hypothetical protein
VSSANNPGPATRLEHDAAHRITVKLLAVIEPCFRGEELQGFTGRPCPS